MSVVRANKRGQCPLCAGSGKVVDTGWLGGATHECPNCKGTGRCGSGLPGAAQRARSRQRGATLEAELDSQLAGYNDAVRRGDYGFANQLWHEVLIRQLALIEHRLRRPFGANERVHRSVVGDSEGTPQR